MDNKIDLKNIDHVLHVLRNPHGWNEDIVRGARIAAADEIERLRTMADRLLAHCPDGECTECAEIVCPHGDGMHFHHDGCPSCWRPMPSATDADLSKCPRCGGPADNGHDRCIPPSAYVCSKCCAQEDAERNASTEG